MPKTMDGHGLIRQFGGTKVWEYNHTKNEVFCKLCTASFGIERRSVIAGHVGTKKHKRNMELLEAGSLSTKQVMLSTAPIQRPVFTMDLATMLVEANIPINKVEHPAFVSFVEKYCKKTVPSRSTLTLTIEEEAKEYLKKIKTSLTGKPLYIALDETTDALGRAMTVILIGDLEQDVTKPYLVDMVDIETPNYSTVQQAVISCLHKLLGEELNFENVKLFLSDGATYCMKAGQALSGIFPAMTHFTCAVHALNRVAELARIEHPKVNALIAETKKVFIKSINRRKEFAASCKIPLPPKPVLTR